MTESTSTTAAPHQLAHLVGSWQGTNAFRMMPTDDFHEAPATATVTTAAGGYGVVLAYTWAHPEDGRQEGILLVGSPEPGQQSVDVAWGDSWHQRPAVTLLSGTLSDGALEVTTDYGGGWRWTIAIGGTSTLRITMDNVIPPEQATEDIQAGPYPVMVAELLRAT
ncbi:DUF1579 family protein [Georgenia subflava]|uniref:DUF1579 domain-containing protein n=1 Tax=Georgenia subflava TaxID=1622177 RepID=A0A6N7EKV5_9MICO|nr:DUF1579 family protein [Georgenia subflava]MPV35904.1 DUF1579 domain-containing protein [Georgenia subflava]